MFQHHLEMEVYPQVLLRQCHERLVIVSNNSENSNYIDHGFTGFYLK